MKRMLRGQVLLLVLALAILCGTAWALQNGMKLMLDDRVLSTDVQIVQGRAYVPLSDVAKALDRTIVKQGRTYRLTLATAASNPRKGMSGKMTEDLFSGKWRLNVASIQMVAAYSPKFGDNKDQITPKEVGDVLAVITCHLQNGAKQMQEVFFDANLAGNTALTDDREHGYVPLAFDSRNGDYTSAKLPAGTIHDFVIVFSVPKGANLKALTYTIGDTGMEASTEFRVALAP